MPSVTEKARSILGVLRPEVTAAKLHALTPDQWGELGRRAGVGFVSPLVQEMVKDRVAAWDSDRQAGMADARSEADAYREVDA